MTRSTWRRSARPKVAGATIPPGALELALLRARDHWRALTGDAGPYGDVAAAAILAAALELRGETAAMLDGQGEGPAIADGPFGD